MKAAYSLFVICGLILPAATAAQPTLNVITGEQMRIDLGNSSVTPNGGDWDIILYMQNDNGVPNGTLPSGFRRWWHVEIGNLNTAGETLNISVVNSEYSDFIQPVISEDGGDTYTRISTGDAFNFTVNTSPGVSEVRVAKYYPVTLTKYDQFRSTINGDSRVTEEVIGTSVQGRPIYMYTITDGLVADAGKERVWIHCAVHPSENTAYFNAEGLITWLLDGSPEAEGVLDNLIINIVPMANPDGVALGNYRTNANSVNLENEWGSPYNSTEPEIVAMQTKIEVFMGTSSSLGQNPIKLLLNLHSSHNVTYPFHFVHEANWPTNGVTTSVRALELQWVNALRNRSPFVDLGSNFSSTLSGRPFVESMMHDRYSIQPEWDDVMAITFEGTYQAGPGAQPGTDDDYRDVGAAMGLALMDYFGISPASTGVDGWMLVGER